MHDSVNIKTVKQSKSFDNIKEAAHFSHITKKLE